MAERDPSGSGDNAFNLGYGVAMETAADELQELIEHYKEIGGTVGWLLDIPLREMLTRWRTDD